jgi:AcrR family transcriptional regulator
MSHNLQATNPDAEPLKPAADTAPSAAGSADVAASAVAGELPAARRPGRPRAGAGEPASRELILEAALRCFSRSGVAATTMAEVAREASMTPAALHYHFKNRELLVEAAFAERLEPLHERALAAVGPDPLADGDPVGWIAKLAEALSMMAAENPWFAPLWAREALSEGGGVVKARMHASAQASGHRERVLSRLQEAQDQGLLTRALPPQALMRAAMSLALFPLAAAQTARAADCGALPFDAAAFAHAVAPLISGGWRGR